MIKRLIFATIIGSLGAFAWIVAAFLISVLVIFMSIGTGLSFGPFVNRNFALLQQISIFGPALFILSASLFFFFVQDRGKRKV